MKTRGKANHLDTDHWFDSVTPQYGLHEARFQQEEFTALVGSPHGILYDGGKDQSTDKFRRTFDVIQQLNGEIGDRNLRVGMVNNFQCGQPVAHRIAHRRLNMRYKIYPSIGFGRIGNSPTHYFIGPEISGHPGFEPDGHGGEIVVKLRPGPCDRPHHLQPTVGCSS